LTPSLKDFLARVAVFEIITDRFLRFLAIIISMVQYFDNRLEQRSERGRIGKLVARAFDFCYFRFFEKLYVVAEILLSEILYFHIQDVNPIKIPKSTGRFLPQNGLCHD
jgi:hypothetical protein